MLVVTLSLRNELSKILKRQNNALGFQPRTFVGLDLDVHIIMLLTRSSKKLVTFIPTRVVNHSRQDIKNHRLEIGTKTKLKVHSPHNYHGVKLCKKNGN